jgi:sedoheptulose-bisphosphatase
MLRYVSPRRRAQRTFELLEVGCREKHPWADHGTPPEEEVRTNANVQITEDIREWDYGDYEGITSAQIREQRGKAGLEPWDIWRDGCPGGEYVHLNPYISVGEVLRRR